MTQQYQELTEQLAALVDAEWPMVSNLANAAALLYERLDRLNWAGFYLTDNHVLWLGHFSGKNSVRADCRGKRRLRDSAADGQRTAGRGRACVSRTYCVRRGIPVGNCASTAQKRRGNRCAGY